MKQRICIAITVALALVLAVAGVRHLVRALLVRDFGAMPPNEVFLRVFHMPVPRGVVSLRVAGSQAGQSGEVWMRMSVRDIDGVISTFKSNGKVAAVPPDEEPGSLLPDNASTDPKNMARIGWPGIPKGSRAEAYNFPSRFDGSGWYGTVLVQRKTGQIFVRGVLY